MLGMQMMLKSMGLDPEEILSSVNKFGATFLALQDQMNRIERKLDTVLAEKLIGETVSLTDETHNGKDLTNDHE